MNMLGCLLMTAKMNLDHVIAFATVDVNDLLSGEGAAADGGALAPVNQQVKDYGAGAFSITRNLVIYVVAIALIGGAGMMAVHAGNANKREEDKSAMGWRFLAAVLAFAGVTVLLFAQKIGEALFQ